MPRGGEDRGARSQGQGLWPPRPATIRMQQARLCSPVPGLYFKQEDRANPADETQNEAHGSAHATGRNYNRSWCHSTPAPTSAPGGSGAGFTHRPGALAWGVTAMLPARGGRSQDTGRRD